METKIEGSNLEKTQKNRKQEQVSESRTKMDYQEHSEYKGYKVKNSGKSARKWWTMRVFKTWTKSKIMK